MLSQAGWVRKPLHLCGCSPTMALRQLSVQIAHWPQLGVRYHTGPNGALRGPSQVSEPSFENAQGSFPSGWTVVDPSCKQSIF